MALFGQLNSGQFNPEQEWSQQKGQLSPPQAGGWTGGNMLPPNQSPWGQPPSWGQQPPQQQFPQQAPPQGWGLPQGLMGYAQQGKGMFPGLNDWAHPNNAFQPQSPVDLSPYESGGGGGGGPSYLGNQSWAPKGWDKGGGGGPTDFGAMSRRQRKRFRKAYNKRAKASGDPKFRQATRQAYLQGGGKKGGFRDWMKQQKKGYGQDSDMSQFMESPIFGNAMMNSASQMMPGLGNIMQSIPGAANMFMQRFGMPDQDYGYLGRNFFGGGRDAGSPG